MVVVEEKKIADVAIEREAVTPMPPRPIPRIPETPRPPTPVPTKEMEQFVMEHEKLKSIIERHKGCVTLATLMAEGGVDEKRLNQHVELFVDDDYVGRVVKDAVCSHNAIKDLKKRLMGGD